MMYYHPHTGRSPLVTDCTWSLQRVDPAMMSKHHEHMALCPICQSMTFVAPEEEVLADLVKEQDSAKRHLTRATNAVELFRQRLAQR